MINKEILKQMGFKKCDSTSGWDHEVWWHSCDCWVHFHNKSNANSEFSDICFGRYLIVDGISETMGAFLKDFLAHYGETIFQSCSIVRGYNE